MKKCVVSMAVPAIFAQLVNVLYSIVDRIYIGHIPDVGSTALTGLGVAVPIISLITAFTALCGTGGAPLCSIARGRGEMERAEHIMGCAFTILIIIGVVLTAVSLAFMRPILYLFGASDGTYPYAAAYARIYVSGTLFVMISLGMNYFINAQGFAKIGMLTVAIGAVLNIILDPVLIFVFNMGIAGAAYATVFSQFCSAAWAMAFLTGRKAILKLRASCLKPDTETVKKILALGVTGFIANVTNSLVMICQNSQLLKYGGDLYVGTMTIINSVREVIFMVVHGFTTSSQPVMGFNYGAGKPERVREVIKFITQAVLVYCAAVWLIVMLIPGALAAVFTTDETLLALSGPSMRLFFCGFIFMGLQGAGQSTFVGLGLAKRAATFSILRKVVIVVPLVYILPLFFGVNGVFIAEPVSDLLGGGACFLTMYFTVYRKLKTQSIL